MDTILANLVIVDEGYAGDDSDERTYVLALVVNGVPHPVHEVLARDSREATERFAEHWRKAFGGKVNT